MEMLVSEVVTGVIYNIFFDESGESWCYFQKRI